MSRRAIAACQAEGQRTYGHQDDHSAPVASPPYRELFWQEHFSGVIYDPSCFYHTKLPRHKRWHRRNPMRTALLFLRYQESASVAPIGKYFALPCWITLRVSIWRDIRLKKRSACLTFGTAANIGSMLAIVRWNHSCAPGRLERNDVGPCCGRAAGRGLPKRPRTATFQFRTRAPVRPGAAYSNQVSSGYLFYGRRCKPTGL
jgi:hypothetical protein